MPGRGEGGSIAGAPAALPATMRKYQRFLVEELSSIATETHMLHRLWYKNQAQLHAMTWWRRLHAVRTLGCRIATGPLQGTVPHAGSMADSRADATGRICVPLAVDTSVLGTQLLLALAQAYTSLWGEEAEGWDRYVDATHETASVYYTAHARRPQGPVYACSACSAGVGQGGRRFGGQEPRMFCVRLTAYPVLCRPT